MERLSDLSKGTTQLETHGDAGIRGQVAHSKDTSLKHHLRGVIGRISTTTSTTRGPSLVLLPWLTPDYGRSSTSPMGPATPGRSIPRRAHVHCEGCAGSEEVQGAQGAARAAPPGSTPAGCGWRWTALSGWCLTLGVRGKRP